ncbi:hypothetical protein K140096H11_11050 [Bacteroides intestinalis]
MGDSQPSNGFAEDGKPAFTLKLCNNLFGSKDFRYCKFKDARCSIHEDFNVTSEFKKGCTFSIVQEERFIAQLCELICKKSFCLSVEAKRSEYPANKKTVINLIFYDFKRIRHLAQKFASIKYFIYGSFL